MMSENPEPKTSVLQAQLTLIWTSAFTDETQQRVFDPKSISANRFRNNAVYRDLFQMLLDAENPSPDLDLPWIKGERNQPRFWHDYIPFQDEGLMKSNLGWNSLVPFRNRPEEKFQMLWPKPSGLPAMKVIPEHFIYPFGVSSLLNFYLLFEPGQSFQVLADGIDSMLSDGVKFLPSTADVDSKSVKRKGLAEWITFLETNLEKRIQMDFPPVTTGGAEPFVLLTFMQVARAEKKRSFSSGF